MNIATLVKVLFIKLDNKKKYVFVSLISIILLNLISIPDIMGLGSSFTNIYSNGVVNYSDGILYWSADFETGDFSQVGFRETLHSGNTYLGASSGSGRGWRVHNTPGTEVYLVTDPVYRGQYAMGSEIRDPSTNVAGHGTTRAEIGRWGQTDETKSIHDLRQGYYGCAIYLPTDFDIPTDSNSWHIIFQLHESGVDGSGNVATGVFALLQVKNRGDKDVFYFWSQVDAIHVDRWESSNPVPLGEWFTVIIYLDASVNGVLRLWIDGDLKGEWYDNFDSNANTGPHVQAGLYQNINDYPIKVYHDSLVVASTYEKAWEMLQ